MKRFAVVAMVLGGGLSAWVASQGCGGGAASTPVVGGTGAFGVITVNGKQLLYYPNQSPSPFLVDGGGGHGYISVIDVGQPGSGMAGANALFATIDLGGYDYATATAGDANVVVAAGTDTYTVWFINPSTNTVTSSIQLDPSLNGNSFSGGSGIVTGIAMDEADNRAILSVWDGFLYVDLGSMTVTGSAISAPSENFGFDGTHELIINPFYNCGDPSSYGDDGGESATYDAGFCNDFQVLDGGGTIAAGVNIVNLKTNKVYTYENLAAEDPTIPLGSYNPDSAAVDPTSQLVAIPPEGSPQEDFLDLSQAVYDDSTLTFTAPFISVPVVSGDGYDGVAIESKTHLAFFEQEFEDTIALIDMTKLSDDAGLPLTALVQATMPNTPVTDAGFGAEPWSNHGDPHGIAVTTGLQSNGPVGFVVTGDGPDLWVARIDLQLMLALGPDAGNDPNYLLDAGLPFAGDAGWSLSPSALGPAITMLNGSAQE